MKNCFDEGLLQAWSDGELAADEAARVAAHVNACAECAEVARTIASENSLLTEGLAIEFAQAVPTERLRDRLDTALAAQRFSPAPQASRSWLNALRDLLPSFRTLAYASAAAAVLLAVTFAFLYFKRTAPAPEIAKQKAIEVAPPVPQSSPPEVAGAIPPKQVNELPPAPRKVVRRKAPQPDTTSLAWQERQYQKAIAKLNDAMKAQAPLRPSLLVEYEYNMALIDTAIATTRDAARKNPKDPQAAQFVLSAYQSKVDLMNQIAETRITDR